MTEVEIFTDGACRGNPGPGGWAALLVAGAERKEVSGAEPATTNNRMELMAAIGGVGALKRRCAVKLYTDSKYVLQGITELNGIGSKDIRDMQAMNTWINSPTPPSTACWRRASP